MGLAGVQFLVEGVERVDRTNNLLVCDLVELDETSLGVKCNPSPP